MKKFLQALSVLAAMGQGLAHAEFKVGSFELAPLVGLEYKYINLEGRKAGNFSEFLDRGHRLPKFFLGTKFDEYASLEFGYASGRESQRERTLGTNDVVFGAPLTEQTLVNSRVKLKVIDLDVNGFMPIAGFSKLSLMGSLGASFTRTDFKIKYTGAAGIRDDAFRSDRRFIPRINFGIEYALKNFAARLKLSWENNRHLQVQRLSDKVFHQPYKNSFGITAGFLFYFL